MKNILVPTDFSPCSKYAADAACLLAKRFGAKLHLLTSLDLPQKWDSMTGPKRLRDAAAQKMIQEAETALSELGQQCQDVDVATVWVGRGILAQIQEYVREHGIDLIVMGSHGASGKSEYFIGSNTQKVVRTVHCPVLVVKNPLLKLDFKKVVFASDFSQEAMPPFNYFKEIIKHFVPEIHLVSIYTSPFDKPYPVKIEEMKPFEDACPPLVCHTHVYSHVSVDHGIRSFAGEIGANLIAISNHDRHPLSRMLVGSNVEALVNHTNLPVLTIDFA